MKMKNLSLVFFAGIALQFNSAHAENNVASFHSSVVSIRLIIYMIGSITATELVKISQKYFDYFTIFVRKCSAAPIFITIPSSYRNSTASHLRIERDAPRNQLVMSMISIS